MVIEEKKPVTITQKTKTGRKLLVMATPVFDENGRIKRVVSISKDITDEEKLKAELYHTKELLQKYERELVALRAANTSNSHIIYRSKAMEKLMETVNKIAMVESTVLIYGETGVGKEVLAKYIHNISGRSEGPFVKINCGAIPENLLEAELFGYEKGAFTGARSEGKPGLFEVADGGTLLLDEISELPLPLQVKLLRVLQEKEFIRVGGIKTIKVDVRIIAASNKDLKELVKEGKFRQDLYYRLNVVPITIPPLRERTEDIPILAHHFLNKYNEKYGRSKQLTNEVIEVFLRYSWPGNVRELEHVIERLVVISEDNLITKKDLPSELLNGEGTYDAEGVYVAEIMPLKKASALVEYQLIKRAMEIGGSTYKAAEMLGVDQSTIIRKLKKYEAMMDSEDMI
jgi:transcriptional regulator with PAS, ATPase and Fis domain